MPATKFSFSAGKPDGRGRPCSRAKLAPKAMVYEGASLATVRGADSIALALALHFQE